MLLFNSFGSTGGESRRRRIATLRPLCFMGAHIAAIPPICYYAVTTLLSFLGPTHRVADVDGEMKEEKDNKEEKSAKAKIVEHRRGYIKFVRLIRKSGSIKDS